jgi:hypothetical protein
VEVEETADSCLSTAIAEYVAAGAETQEAIWLRKLLLDLDYLPKRETSWKTIAMA